MVFGDYKQLYKKIIQIEKEKLEQQGNDVFQTKNDDTFRYFFPEDFWLFDLYTNRNIYQNRITLKSMNDFSVVNDKLIEADFMCKAAIQFFSYEKIFDNKPKGESDELRASNRKAEFSLNKYMVRRHMSHKYDGFMKYYQNSFLGKLIGQEQIMPDFRRINDLFCYTNIVILIMSEVIRNESNIPKELWELSQKILCRYDHNKNKINLTICEKRLICEILFEDYPKEYEEEILEDNLEDFFIGKVKMPENKKKRHQLERKGIDSSICNSDGNKRIEEFIDNDMPDELPVEQIKTKIMEAAKNIIDGSKWIENKTKVTRLRKRKISAFIAPFIIALARRKEDNVYNVTEFIDENRILLPVNCGEDYELAGLLDHMMKYANYIREKKTLYDGYRQLVITVVYELQKFKEEYSDNYVNEKELIKNLQYYVTERMFGYQFLCNVTGMIYDKVSGILSTNGIAEREKRKLIKKYVKRRFYGIEELIKKVYGINDVFSRLYWINAYLPEALDLMDIYPKKFSVKKLVRLADKKIGKLKADDLDCKKQKEIWEKFRELINNNEVHTYADLEDICIRQLNSLEIFCKVLGAVDNDWMVQDEILDSIDKYKLDSFIFQRHFLMKKMRNSNSKYYDNSTIANVCNDYFEEYRDMEKEIVKLVKMQGINFRTILRTVSDESDKKKAKRGEIILKEWLAKKIIIKMEKVEICWKD